ncbi:hypothetical protein [uncultured Senegalimassilia sp.]|uniref:hypothetical protein n=1 Tax=uncultured Senegalimassilia sp. TaxID=1714350 RepID=UPI0025CFFA05|nr:hypothetical protein [uncultured Senegalimassilia sp.]
MRKRNPEQRARHARECSPTNGAERRTGTKIACVGVSALIAGQLFMPAASLAAESANQDAAAGDVVAAAPAASAPVADSAPAGQQTEPQQAQPAVPAATANDAADSVAAPANAAAAEQNDPVDIAATPQADAIMPCGVTDSTENPGGIKVNTTEVDHYTDCALPSNITLAKGQSYTFDFPDVEGGIPEEPHSVITEVKYYRADAASGSLVEVLDESMADVTARFEPVGNHMRLTLSFTGGAASGSYRLTRSDDLLVNATLTYVSTDYGGGILIGDPDKYYEPGSITINETRDNYYIRYSIDSEITLVAAENEALENLNVDNVKTDYAPGEAPRATATIPAADADKYEVAYECWEEMELDMESGESVPVAFWYSDPGKYAPGMKKIDAFEEGKFYMYSVELRLKGDNTVGDDCMMYVNGHWTHHIKTVNGVFAPNADNMLCEQPIDEWRAIDVIEINGATTSFKAGDKPVFTASVPTGSNSLPQCEFWTGSDGSEVNSQKFWDQNITNHIDAFKPGVTYRYGIYLKSARGFYFTPDTKLMINGQECGYQVADSVSDDDSGWIYTLWLSTDLTFTPEGVAPESQPGGSNGGNGGTTDADEPAKPAAAKEATKPVMGNLAATGDDAALMAAALSIAGATAATAVAAARRRNR